jgi:protein subunit release factor A
MIMKKEHLFSVTKKDLDIQTFKAGGKGGQNQNKRDTGVRIVHRESGAVGECREERSQLQNKKKAFRRMIEDKKFQLWINRRAYEEIKGKTIRQVVEEQMKPENLKVEVVDEDGRWKEIHLS